MNINVKEINDITHEQLLKMHGKRITCDIDGVYIDDARISVNEYDTVFVCQNIKGTNSLTEKFGYKYIWVISRNRDEYEIDNRDCTNIIIEVDLDKAIDDISPSNEYQQQQFKNKLNDVLIRIELMLTEKNRKYGNSALEPINIFSKLDKIEQLKISIDHKLKRIQNQQQDDTEDNIDDLIGYLILLKIAKIED